LSDERTGLPARADQWLLHNKRRTAMAAVKKPAKAKPGKTKLADRVTPKGKYTVLLTPEQETKLLRAHADAQTRGGRKIALSRFIATAAVGSAATTEHVLKETTTTAGMMSAETTTEIADAARAGAHDAVASTVGYLAERIAGEITLSRELIAGELSRIREEMSGVLARMELIETLVDPDFEAEEFRETRDMRGEK
jgi:hypothetical protein